VAAELERRGESEWSARVLDARARIDHFGYGDDSNAKRARVFAADTLTELLAAHAAQSIGLAEEIEYVIGWITRYLQGPRRPRDRNRGHQSRSEQRRLGSSHDIRER
jgi:hypothetical protein